MSSKTNPESYLSKLYTSQPLTLPEDIKEYVLNPKGVKEEVEYLSECVATKEVDLTKVIFMVEVLSKSIRKHSEFREHVKVLVRILETYKDYEYSVFSLRIIKSIVESRFYVPLSFYILRILRNAIASKNITIKNKSVDYDSIKPTPDRTRSEEHQMFVIKEANLLLMQHLSAFSKNIGFPELAGVVTNELKKMRIGIYKEVVGDMISNISKHKDYFLRKRHNLKLNGLDGNTIAAFESTIEKTL